MTAVVLAEPETKSETTTAESVFIQAERVERRGALTIATGNVHVQFEGLQLNCQKLIYDPSSGLVRAEDECLFSWGENFASSDSLVLDTISKTAELEQVAGRSGELSVGAKSFEGNLYFWADKLLYSESEIRLQRAVLTTCDVEANDLHYQINAEDVLLYPQDRVVASNSSVTIQGKQLYTLPTMVLPLNNSKRRQNYFPSPGYNSLDGAFIRNTINYDFDQRNYGTLRLDLYQKSGIGYGGEHFFDYGERGTGNIYFYNQNGSQTSRNRFELRDNGDIKIDEHTRLGLAYNASQFELPGQVSPLNVSGAVNISRYAPGSALQIGANFARNGDNNNRNYRFYYDLDLDDRWSILTRADFARSSTAITQTNRYHYLGSLRHRGDFFEGDLSYERSGGQNTYFLNRQPELSLRSHQFKLGGVPLVASASFGILEESPSLFSTERYRFDLKVPDQIIETGLGNFHAGAGFRQQLYGGGQEQFVLGTRLGWTHDIADHLLLRLDYNRQDAEGFTPFQHDLAFDYQVLSGGIELYNKDKFRVSATGAYDLNFDQAYDIITRVDMNPFPGWELTASANLDPNAGVWKSIDSGVTAQLTPGVSLTHWSIYDLFNGRMTYQNFSVNYEDHDWIGSLTYRGVQNEVFLQLSLKAFPLRPVKIGPDASLPVVPGVSRNAFTR